MTEKRLPKRFSTEPRMKTAGAMMEVIYKREQINHGGISIFWQYFRQATKSYDSAGVTHIKLDGYPYDQKFAEYRIAVEIPLRAEIYTVDEYDMADDERSDPLKGDIEYIARKRWKGWIHFIGGMFA